MRLGQISAISFLSRFSASVIGFVATLYIARTLGSEPLGIYYVTLGVVSWLSIVGQIGVSRAISKRVSEGVNEGRYAAAGLSIISVLFLIIATGLLAFRSQVDSYIGYPATLYIILMVLVTLANAVISPLLAGLHLVHVQGILSTIKASGQSIFQIILVLIGFGTVGLFVGHIAGNVVIIAIGGYVVGKRLTDVNLPTRDDFRSVIDYAKFSWLSDLSAQMFHYTDVIVLSFFVSSGLIGVYGVAWNISIFLTLFGSSVKATLFPEMSKISAGRDPQAISDLVTQGLTYSGLLLLPGVLGGAILGHRILLIYGEEFTVGANVLIILILANLLMGYQGLLVTTLDGIDRPDLGFRVNAVFIGMNLGLNVILIHFYGVLGAAIATASSVWISLIFAHRLAKQTVDFEWPVTEILKQAFSAVLMAAFVYAGLELENTLRLLNHNFATVLLLVLVGAGIYFGTLFGISNQFRQTIDQNLSLEFIARSR